MTAWVFRVKRYMGPCVYFEAPDGGWGWVVAVAFFLVEVFTYGVIKSFGIFLQDLMGEFGESNSRVSWIISICVFVMTFTAPLSSVMTNRFGFRPVVMIGGFLISMGTITSGFTNSINQMYITIGIVSGLGYCLTFLPTVTILSQYFTHRRSLVTAAASTGESFSMFALAPAFSALRDSMGWRYTVMVIGALQGTIIICGALLRPIIIKHNAAQVTETEGLALKELEALNTQENSPIRGDSIENSYIKDSSETPKSSYSQDNVLTHSDFLSAQNSGVQAPHDPEEKTLLQGKEGREELRKSALGIREKEESKEWGKQEEEITRREEKGEGDKEKEEREREKTGSTQRSKLLDFSILREGSFICYSLFGLFATLGFFAPQLYIIELSVSRGVERDRATYMLSAMAVAEIFGRLSVGWVLGRKQVRQRKPLVLLGCVVLLSLVLVAFTQVFEFWGLAVCCGLYGFFMGTVASTHIPMLAEEDVVGIERMTSAAGVYVFIQSFAGLAGPPLGGFLVDMTLNYGSAFYSCALGMGLGALFLGMVRPAKRGLPCIRKGGHNSPEPVCGAGEPCASV